MKIIIVLGLMWTNNVWAITVSDASNVGNLITETILKNQKIENSGVSVSVFNKKEIIFQKGYGFSNQDEKKEVTPHTAFAIGSTTKAFTALGLKLLENKKTLKVTDRVIDHLSDFKLSNEAITQETTIEDLLSHRVGLPRHDLMWVLSDFSREENYRRLKFLSFPDKAEEKFRKTFSYNNFLFMVAGKIIEHHAVQSFEEFTRENILNPLEMRETSFFVPKNHSDLAEPYYGQIRVKHRDLTEVGPAGSIYSTSSDMTKWIQSFMNNKWENQDDLFRPRIALDNENPNLDYSYGLAWVINRMNKDYSWYFHDGAIDGFSTAVLFSKELDLGIVVLVNQNGSDLGDKIILSLLKYEIAKRPVIKSFTGKRNYKLGHTDIGYNFNVNESNIKLQEREPLKTYCHPGYGVISTFEADNKLYADYYGNVWELKAFEHEYFNYLIDLAIGADHFDFPFRVNEGAIVAPFQAGVPLIEFNINNNECSFR